MTVLAARGRGRGRFSRRASRRCPERSARAGRTLPLGRRGAGAGGATPGRRPRRGGVLPAHLGRAVADACTRSAAAIRCCTRPASAPRRGRRSRCGSRPARTRPRMGELLGRCCARPARRTHDRAGRLAGRQPGVRLADDPVIAAASPRIERATGTRPLAMRSGGSIPVMAALVARGTPTILSGFGTIRRQHPLTQREDAAAQPGMGVRSGARDLPCAGRQHARGGRDWTPSVEGATLAPRCE